MNIYYVYLYKDPDTLLPFYVGKGKYNRYKHHLSLYKSDPNRLKKNIIRRIKDSGRLPIIEFYVTDVSEDVALVVEAALIKKYGRQDIGTGILCNLTDGGEGTTNKRQYIRTSKHKDNISKVRSNSNWYFNPLTLEERAIANDKPVPDGFIPGRSISMAGEKNGMYGKTRSDKWRADMRQWHKDHPNRPGPNRKTVTVNGVVYSSLTQANAETGLSLYKLRQLITK